MDKPRIIVVDGDPKNLQILKESLESADFEVTTSRNGDDAWSRIQTRRPDIIVSEVDIPGLDGFQLLQKLQKDPGSSSIPMVFLTNRRNLQDRIKSLRTGVKDYMIKPLHVKEVIARLQMILRRIESLQNDNSVNHRKIVGRLEDSSVEKLIENYGAEQKTGVLSLYDNQDRNGEIYFNKGSVVNARLDNYRAEKAVYQMLPWVCGHFIMTLKEVTVEDEITVSNLGLLLQGFKRSQELENLLVQLPPMDSVFVKTKLFDQILKKKAVGSDALKFISLFDGQAPISSIILESTYDELKTLQRIFRLHEQGFIEPLSEQNTEQENLAGDVQHTLDMETSDETDILSFEPDPTEEITHLPDPVEEVTPASQVEETVELTKASEFEQLGPEAPANLPDAVETSFIENVGPIAPPEETPDESLALDDADEAVPEETQHPITEEADEQTPIFRLPDSIELEQPFDLEPDELDLSELQIAPARPIADETTSEERGASSEEADDGIERPGETSIQPEETDLGNGAIADGPKLSSLPDTAENEEDLQDNQPEIPEITKEHLDEKEFVLNGKKAAVGPSPRSTTNPLSAICSELCQERGLKKGHLVVLAGNQDARKQLVGALTADCFSSKNIGADNNSVLFGEIATNSDATLGVLGLSTEKKFLQVLEQVSDTLVGCIILVVGDSATGLGYLGYLLNSLKGTLAAPSVVAVYQPEGERRVPLEFVRYSLKMDEGEQIVEVKFSEIESLNHMLKQLKTPAYQKASSQESPTSQDS